MTPELRTDGGHGRLRVVLVAGAVVAVVATGTSVSASVAPGGSAVESLRDDQVRLGEQLDRRMEASEVPPEVLAPAAVGDGSVASFGRFLDTVREGSDGRAAPRPETLEQLAVVTSASAFGEVASVELVLEEVALGDLRSARIDLVLVLDQVEPIKATDLPLATWTKTAWEGDPVVAPGMLERLQVELGPGPIGAEAVLFANAVLEGDGGPVLGVFDGLVDDGESVARLSLVVPEPAGELASVAAAREVLAP